MAIARTSHLIGAISGAIDSVIFANTNQGLLIKHRPQKNDQATKRQLHARAAFRRTQLHWRELTDAQRKEYAVRAETVPFTNRLGVVSRLSGYHYFLHSQITTAFWGAAFWDFPPYPAQIRTIEAITLTFTQGGPFTILIEASPITRYAVTKAHRPFSSSARTAARYFKTIGKYEFTTFDSFNIYPDFVPLLGDPTAGESLTINLNITDYLQPTSYWPPLILTTTVLAP